MIKISNDSSAVLRIKLQYDSNDKTILTLYHTIPTFNDPEKEGFRKHCGKKRKCW